MVFLDIVKLSYTAKVLILFFYVVFEIFRDLSFFIFLNLLLADFPFSVKQNVGAFLSV